VALALAVLAAGACSSGSGDGADEDRSTTASTASTASTTTAPLSGAEVVESLRRSVALVETPAGSGSAVLLEDGYLVTNAHVVDPFRRVTVTLDGEGHDVDVVGVDLVADIAVVGPLPVEAEGPPVTLADPGGLTTGDELFLVGYPGTTDDPEVTVTEGVLSRRRQVPGWKLELLQTDAEIAEGQSGGVLADTAGRVVGISGYSYDDQFSLAVAGPAAQDSVEAILDDRGSEWSPLPPLGQPRDEGASLDLRASGQSVLFVPNVRDLPDLEVRFPADVPVELEVTDLALETVALNEAADAFYREDPDDDPSARPEPTPPSEPGTWTFDVAIDEPVLVFVSAADDRARAEVTSSLPFEVLNPQPALQSLDVGEPVEGTVSAFDDTDTYLLDLRAGQSVAITASSAFGDMAFTLVPPEGGGEGIEADDGGGGLFDLDATGTFTARAEGTHILHVSQVDGYATAYRVAVEPG